MDRAQQFARRYRYVLQCDVREFFPSIDHACLRGILERKIADPDLLLLIDQILDNGAEVLRRYRSELARGEIDLETLRGRVQGWVAHAAHADTWGLRRALLREPLPAVQRSRP